MLQRHSTRRAAGAIAAVSGSALAAACTGGTDFVQTTFHPVSEYGAMQNAVFHNTFWWTMGILALVLILVVYVVVRFRDRPGAADPPQIHGNTKLEIIWTIIPAIIVVFIGVPTVQTIFATQQRPSDDALTIEVVGRQWWWEFNYPEQGVRTANLLYLPVGREIHLRMHSADVLHSFWIPRIGGKRDVVPLARAVEGQEPRYNHIVFTVDEAGTYPGQCAEFCGTSHAIMSMTSVAVSPEEFDAWVESMRHTPVSPPATPVAADTVDVAPAADTMAVQPPVSAADPLVEQGRQVFLSRSCIACHAVSNTTAQGRVGPDLTRFALRPTVGAGARPNTQENVEAWIRRPRALKAGALMPGVQEEAAGFPATGLNDEEIRAVAAYLLSLN